MAKILFLIPDTKQYNDMAETLRKDDNECTIVRTPSEGLAMTEQNLPRLTVMDTGFAWSDTAPLLEKLAAGNRPVLFLSHERSNSAHMKAMYHGLCEVLPVNCRQGALRRAANRLLEESTDKLICGGLVMDLTRRTAALNGHRLVLTAQEFSLLQALMEAPNTTVTREQLLKTAWGYIAIGETRTVDVHVQRLRRKLGAGAIETVYRAGYRLIMG